MTTPSVSPVRDTRAPRWLATGLSVVFGMASGGLIALGAALIVLWGDGEPTAPLVLTTFLLGGAASAVFFIGGTAQASRVIARAGLTGAGEWAVISLLGLAVPVSEAAARTADVAPPPITWMLAHSLVPITQGFGPFVAALTSLLVGILGLLAARAALIRER